MGSHGNDVNSQLTPHQVRRPLKKRFSPSSLWSALIFSRVTSQDFYFVTISISKRWVKLVLLKKDLCDRHLSSWSAKVTRVRILPTKFCFSFDSYTFYLANTKGNVELVVRSTLVGEVRRDPKSLRGDCEQFSSLVL